MDETYCNITFQEKVRIYSYDHLKCCVYLNQFDTPRHVFTKKLYAQLITSSHLLEDFLDFNGAKNNKDWYFYREMTATIRHLSLAGYSQQHILNRLAFYDLGGGTNEFRVEGEKTLDLIINAIMKAAPVILDEARRLKIDFPEKKFERKRFPGIATDEMLEYDIDDEDKRQQKKNIVKVASEFLCFAKEFNSFVVLKPFTIDEIKEIVPTKVNEVEMRRLEMLVHNLQSSFDSYVIHGGYRFGNRKLKQLRSNFSLLYRLLQIIGRLLHFYERHIHEIGYKTIYQEVRNELVHIIDPDMILDRTINYGLFYVCHFLNFGQDLAKEMLNENIERSSITVGIPVQMGFHSRPSLMVAKIVQHFGGQVELVVGKDRFDASSVLDIQWAGGKIDKEKITRVVFEGDVRALHDIEILASVNYGEDSMGKGIPLPLELLYLK